MTSYDRVPYRSDPFPHSQPDRLKVLANIFGLEAPDVHTARVIELGCAAGNNIIPLAFNFPQSTFVGIDSSRVQIEAGLKTIADLGLKKIRLLTNNPKKIVGLEGYGLKVMEKVPMHTKANKSNKRYLMTKKEKLGHEISI